jgi:hypothetical protein
MDSRKTRAMAMLRQATRCAILCATALGVILLTGCGSGHGSSGATFIVNTLDDIATPATGVVTLRSAVEQASSGDTITFAPALDGGTIALSIVGSDHSILKGETYTGMTFEGYNDRDYGKSALYARKDLTIDASALSHGITVTWTGGDTNRARVLSVGGNLTMRNVTITGGHSSAEALTGGTQPYTLARGGGLAVWGVARLDRCTVAGNKCTGDPQSSRDRGTYGGGIYSNGLTLTGCVISGNAVVGYGAAGGGIYSVGGADSASGVGNNTMLTRCTVSGNRVTAQHAYGGGIFTLSGGPNNLATMTLTNCTIARNLVEDNPSIAEAGQYYYRGGGVYMGGGSLSVVSCTIAENEVSGNAATFSGKPNMGGGGVAATIGNAHTVETVRLRQSVVVGNKLNGANNDWMAGSILDFFSEGYNLIGLLDFSQILVPAPDWMDLCRKHYPKIGDLDGVSLLQALDVSGAQRSATVTSVGTDDGQAAVLWYPPAALALDQVTTKRYAVTSVSAGYTGFGVSSDTFLNYVIAKIRTDYASTLGSDFGASFGDMTGVTWYGPRVTWPSEPANAPWIAFWRSLDTAIGDKLGVVALGDDFWGTFTTVTLSDTAQMTVDRQTSKYSLTSADQRGVSRPAGTLGDIGAIER